MDKIRLGLVGCGGMGMRHLHGLKELSQTPFCNVELVAVCDIDRDSAEHGAADAEDLLGTRPEVYTDLGEMVAGVCDLTAVDVVIDPSYHEKVVCQALDLGLHVMVEKPLAVTIKGCQTMIEAAKRNDRQLSVAENYRRDPSARLVHHLLAEGAIGSPYMAIYHAMSPGDEIFITPWRHLKDRGGLLLDMGVHFTDLIRYQLGDVAEVYGDARLVEPVRRKSATLNSPYRYYQDRFKKMAEEVPATAEDMSVALLKMESGVTVSWIVGSGGHGSCGGNGIWGDRGVVEGFGTRGGSTAIKRVGQEEVGFAELVAAADDFELEPLAAHLFPNRMATGDAAVDWKLLALEYFELAEAVLSGRQLEVDGVEGMKDVAVINAILESSRAGRAVKMSEVESGQLYEYQAEIDAAMGEVDK
jgi:predicted dehydrogenase